MKVQPISDRVSSKAMPTEFFQIVAHESGFATYYFFNSAIVRSFL